jgi:hypothetical protein
MAALMAQYGLPMVKAAAMPHTLGLISISPGIRPIFMRAWIPPCQRGQPTR